MRSILVQVPRGAGGRVLEIARSCNGTNLSLVQASAPGGDRQDLVVVHLANNQVGPFVDALDPIPEVHLSMAPQGVFTLQPPASTVPQQVQDVNLRSPFEVFLSGLQSIGSWRGFIGYAAFAGVVVWLGLFTNTIYLLVAAMLIAPFAGPAMNVAIATARGDLTLLWHSLLRYFAALGVTVLVSGLLSFLFQQSVATEQMAATANISAPAALLPLAAGAAGALNLVQSQRSSLVSGAAVGMLVAASLAPPAGLIGMAAVLGRWEMVQSGAFLLALQLVGINLAGALVFRLAGLRPEGPRYSRGRSAVGWGAAVATLIGLCIVLLWQFGSPAPTLQRATIQERARDVVRQTVDADGEVYLAEVNSRFTRPDIPGQNTLLVTLYVQRQAGTTTPDDALRRRLTEQVRQAIERQGFNVTPLVDVTVLEAPAHQPR